MQNPTAQTAHLTFTNTLAQTKGSKKQFPSNVNVRTINEHLQTIFNDNELQKDSVVRNFRITASDGKNYNTQHYNLSAYLDIAEDMAIRQIPMTMEDWESRFITNNGNYIFKLGKQF